jgi:hypothetical protein
MSSLHSPLMQRLRRMLPPTLLMLSVMLVCGWLLMAPVRQTTVMLVIPTAERGWPWGFQSFELYGEAPKLLDGLTRASVNVGFLAADVAILLAIAAAAVAAFAWRHLRHHCWFRFSIRELLLLTAVCAVPAALWAQVNANWKRERMLAERFSKYPASHLATWTYCAPAWLRRFVPWSKQETFVRINTFFVDWNAHENAATEIPAAIDQLRFVTNLTITANTPVQVCDVSLLSRIETLDISGAGVDDDTMKWISQLPHLKTLHIVSDNGGPCPITYRGFALLANCRELTEIICSQRVNLTADAIQPLIALMDLRDLEFNDTHITPKILATIAKLQHLTNLWLIKCSFSASATLTELTALPRLESLSIEKSDLTDAELATLRQCPALSKLYLAVCPNVTDEGIAELVAFPHLKHLFFGRNPYFRSETYQALYKQIPNIQIWGN